MRNVDVPQVPKGGDFDARLETVAVHVRSGDSCESNREAHWADNTRNVEPGKRLLPQYLTSFHDNGQKGEKSTFLSLRLVEATHSGRRTIATKLSSKNTLSCSTPVVLFLTLVVLNFNTF